MKKMGGGGLHRARGHKHKTRSMVGAKEGTIKRFKMAVASKWLSVESGR